MIIRNFVYLSFSFITANVFGYVFHAIVSRELGPPLYAEFSVLYAFMIALSRPANIVSGAVTRVAVNGRLTGAGFEEIKKFSTRLGVISGLIISLGTLLFSYLIQIFLKVDDLLVFLPISLTLFIWCLTATWRGLFASVELFKVLSFASIMELFARAIAGITFVLLGLKVFGAIACSAVGAIAVLSMLLSRKKIVAEAYNNRKQYGASESGFSSITAKFFFVSIPMGFLPELDLLLAKRFFSPEDAGIYAASALIGKGLLMFSAVASTVVYPKLIEERLSKKGILAFLFGVGITILLFAAGYVFLKLFGKPVIGILFGDKYKAVIELVPMYTLALIPLALHLQVTNYKGAVGGWIEGIWLWIVLIGYYLSLEIFSSNFYLYLKAIFVFHLILTPLSFIILYLRHRK